MDQETGETSVTKFNSLATFLMLLNKRNKIEETHQRLWKIFEDFIMNELYSMFSVNRTVSL